MKPVNSGQRKIRLNRSDSGAIKSRLVSILGRSALFANGFLLSRSMEGRLIWWWWEDGLLLAVIISMFFHW
jgi:hypothetical protein